MSLGSESSLSAITYNAANRAAKEGARTGSTTDREESSWRGGIGRRYEVG